jgi:hypothetical protein
VTPEYSEAGQPILRHASRAATVEGTAHAQDDRIVRHVERTHGPVAVVWHEAISDAIHLDVHIAAPVPDDPVTLLVTSGMSARPMTVPRGVRRRRAWRYAELCMLLPADWPIPDPGGRPSPDTYWPIELLKSLARIPHDYDTWFGVGHSANTEPLHPYVEGSRLSGAILLPARGSDRVFRVPGRPALHLFQVFLVTEFEMQLKLDHGLSYLLDVFGANGIDPFGANDPHRHVLERGDL